MSTKSDTTTTSANQPALKIGSRVRCTDDGITGRIAWANAVSVKLKWDDGEQVTWRRDSLAGRPIEILDADEEARPEQPAVAPVEQQVEQPAAAPAQAQVAPTEPPAPAVEPVLSILELAADSQPQATDTATTAVVDQVPEASATEAASAQTGDTTPTLVIFTSDTATSAKPKRERKARTPAEPGEKKLSALDAAVKVLAEAGTMMTPKELIGAMSIKGYWTSPGGKTPDATLAAAMIRDISVKGDQSRFVKAAPGRFALRRTV